MKTETISNGTLRELIRWHEDARDEAQDYKVRSAHADTVVALTELSGFREALTKIIDEQVTP